MTVCPKCKGRATKLVNISTGTITCQRHNAFGGEAQTFDNVDDIEVEPARADDEDDE